MGRIGRPIRLRIVRDEFGPIKLAIKIWDIILLIKIIGRLPGATFLYRVDLSTMSNPFEGTEKLLELWFAPSAAAVPGLPDVNGKAGLRRVDRKVWEDMLKIVKCEVLSVMEGNEIDAYLLRSLSLSFYLSYSDH